MGYVSRVVRESSMKKELGGRSFAAKPLYIDSAECAFCRGSGTNPHSKYARCPVCGGSGNVGVHPPVVTCAFCRGEGHVKWGVLTCSVCFGKGVVSVKEPIAPCPRCRGTGENPSGRLYCIECRGKGVISVKAAENPR